MSAPRTKRQFAGAASDPAQRQITSFFGSSNAASSPSSSSINNTSAPRPQTQADPSTQLPASVQANLISVGMRVRKSVPEGYKTGSYSAFALWDDRSPDTSADADMGQRSRANAFSTPKELLPFCGINKVGGMDTQSEHPHPALAYQALLTTNNTSDGMDDVPGLTSSQETVDSTISSSSYAKTRKRFFTEDNEDEPSGRLNASNLANFSFNFDGDVSPRSLAPTGWGNGRIMAVPRKGRLRGKLAGTRATEQENVMIVDSDFGEADFLDQKTWEVDMSDA
ncbi:ribonucleotide reductase inhibitor-domain-containing protein [Xylariaceae sp. FL0016]|nr:ribonucleotide reductase inhibitor-domain-containing protein [Xylariaceae sp. FL0016]